MKKNLTLAIFCTMALAGCAFVKETDESATQTVHDNYQDVKDTVVAAKKVVAAGADEAGDHALVVGNAAKSGFYQGTDHIAGWMTPSVPKPNQPIAASYCYHVLQDILCYRRPMPGWENRLAGYQPMGAEPPAPAMMQPLPKRALDTTQLPANRVANSKPVFNEMPVAPAEKPAEDAATPAGTGAPEASHEQLPNPAMVPQL